jgi:hypothetical protein
VAAGHADAMVTNSFSAARLASRYRLRESPLIFLANNLYFAAPEGRNADLLARIDVHLGAWRHQPDSIYYDATLEYRRRTRRVASEDFEFALA